MPTLTVNQSHVRRVRSWMDSVQAAAAVRVADANAHSSRAAPSAPPNSIVGPEQDAVLLVPFSRIIWMAFICAFCARTAPK